MRPLARIGLLLLAASCFWLSAINAIRFAIEFGVSPTRYLLQDGLLALAGALGAVACWMKSNNLGSTAISSWLPTVSPAEKVARARRFNIAAAVLLVAYFLLSFIRKH